MNLNNVYRIINIRKTKIHNLKFFILARNMEIFDYLCGDVCALLGKNKLLYEEIVINDDFDVILSADGNIEINKSEEHNLLKNIKIETDIFEERAG